MAHYSINFEAAGILHPGQAALGVPHSSQVRHSGTLGHHDRSSSAPNVSIHSTRGGGDDCPRSLPLNRSGNEEPIPHSKSTQASPTG